MKASLRRDRRVAVRDRRPDVERDEDQREQRQVAVEIGDGEPRPALAAPAARAEHAEQRRRGQEEERDDAGGAGQVPERGHGVSSGQPLTVTTAPSAAASLAGSPRSASQAGAASPSTTDAVLAALASTHEPAATVTVRQGVSAGRAVRGSTMWWSSPPEVVQRRTCVPELASPPADDRNGRTGPVERRGVVVGDPHRPAAVGGRTRDGDVAAEGDEHAGADRPCDRRRRAVGGERLRSRAEIELDAVRDANRPTALGRGRPWSSRGRVRTTRATRRPSRRRTSANVRSYPARRSVRPMVGSTRPSVRASDVERGLARPRTAGGRRECPRPGCD